MPGSGQTEPIYEDDNTDYPSRQTGATRTGGTVTKLVGKAEAGFGSLIGNQNLQARGLEKEARANTGNTQGLGQGMLFHCIIRWYAELQRYHLGANAANVGLSARHGNVPQGAGGMMGGYFQ